MTGMTPIVQTVTRLLAGLMFVYGVYVVLHGHLTPGGGFAGGVVIAGAFLLRLLAFGRPPEKTAATKDRASRMEAAGIFTFWVLALFGLFAVGIWFRNALPLGQPFALTSAGEIPLYNISIGVEVAAALVCVYVALLLTKREAAS